jgi:transcriptional regulator with XRE-family HTH domain
MNIGQLVKDYRQEHNLSMDDFALRTGLSKGYISMLENNKNPSSNKPIAPTLPSLKKIANGMGKDIDTLIKMLDGQKIQVGYAAERCDSPALHHLIDDLLTFNDTGIDKTQDYVDYLKTDDINLR